MVRENAWKTRTIYKRSVTQQHINHSALGTIVNCYILPFVDDPNLPLPPLVPADSNKAKKKAIFPGFHFVHQHNSIAVEAGSKWWGVSCLQLPLPSWCSIQYTTFGSTTLSTLVHGCEETPCYLLFADRHRVSRRIRAGLFLLDTYHQEAFCYIIKNVQYIAPSPRCEILTAPISSRKTTAIGEGTLEGAIL